jgi:hypothetical protein
MVNIDDLEIEGIVLATAAPSQVFNFGAKLFGEVSHILPEGLPQVLPEEVPQVLGEEVLQDQMGGGNAEMIAVRQELAKGKGKVFEKINIINLCFQSKTACPTMLALKTDVDPRLSTLIRILRMKLHNFCDLLSLARS